MKTLISLFACISLLVWGCSTVVEHETIESPQDITPIPVALEETTIESEIPSYLDEEIITQPDSSL